MGRALLFGQIHLLCPKYPPRLRGHNPFVWLVLTQRPAAQLCPVRGLKEYIKVTASIRRSDRLFVCFCSPTALHTLRYCHTSLSGIPNVPEFVSVVFVDDVQISHYDSDTKTCVSKQDWMDRVTQDDPRFWDKQTQDASDKQRREKVSLDEAKRLFSVNEGVHTWQNLFGCDWDDQTDQISRYDQYGFDGEDFISFDFDSETFVARTELASVTKQRWEQDGETVRLTNASDQCVKDLKRAVSLGERVLKRTVLPSISFLQKTSHSSVFCVASSFYPESAMMFWTEDGEVLREPSVHHGEVLPNLDGTYQLSVELLVSPFYTEDSEGGYNEKSQEYHCVFHLSGLQQEINTKVEENNVRRNERATPVASIVVPVVIIVVIVVFVVVCLIRSRRRRC
ncbi:hypothetical protein WMY93_004866 [Mugilogobius chulae]|uniref:Ig-like domain-containing protein n=1 Tax=Mugilogobius chulae TaxID=88201 RepID=A0AAW0PPL9_9GOBI